MRNSIFCFILAAIVLAACTPATSSPTQDMSEKVLRHVVLFKFKDSSSESDVETVHQSFLELAGKIPVIKAFEWGLNDSPEDFHQGFTHCYIISFASEADRDSVYTPHPAHQAFVAGLQPHLDKVFVVDFWANEVAE